MTLPPNPLPSCPNSPNCARRTVLLKNSPSTALKIIHNHLTKMGAKEFDLDADNLSIHAVFVIPVMGFKDDVKVLIETHGEGSAAHFRSASRDGYYDLGVNERRLKKLVKRMNKDLSILKY